MSEESKVNEFYETVKDNYKWVNSDKSFITEDLSKLVDNGEDIEQLFVSLIEIANFMVAIRRSLSPDAVPKIAGMAARVAEVGEELGQEVGGLDTLEKTIEALRLSKEEAKENTSKVGLFALLRTMNDPDIQYGLKFMLSLAKNMSKALK